MPRISILRATLLAATACALGLTSSIGVRPTRSASVLTPQAAQVDSRGSRGTAAEFAPGRVWVKVRNSSAAARLGGTLQPGGRRATHVPTLGLWRIDVAPGTEQEILEELRRDSSVAFAELDYRVTAMDEPNDARRPEQWALDTIHCPEAWDLGHCDNVIVAVLDSGVDTGHPDLSRRLWTNPGETPNNGRDDDGNGKVDDVYGWHFYQNCASGSCVPYENHVVQDDNGHGTHVTGIAAADTGNGIGIASVSWGALAMTVKVLDEYGEGYYSDVALGIRYATDNGARIINLSFGGPQPSLILQEAVDYAHQRGVLIIASAGNDGGAVYYPAACEHVMAVASTDRNDQRSSFSNVGPQVDIAAPGESILSTWPWLDGYFYKRGTSMAAPHVAGAAALLWSLRPDYQSTEIEQRLLSQSDDVNAAQLPGPDPYLGWGRLNVYQALAGLSQGPTLTPTPTATCTPTPTPTATPTVTATNTPHILRLLLIFRNYAAPNPAK
jgi:thermitase